MSIIFFYFLQYGVIISLEEIRNKYFGFSLELVRRERLNRAENPCNPDVNYKFTKCIKQSVSQTAKPWAGSSYKLQFTFDKTCFASSGDHRLSLLTTGSPLNTCTASMNAGGISMHDNDQWVAVANHFPEMLEALACYDYYLDS